MLSDRTGDQKEILTHVLRTFAAVEEDGARVLDIHIVRSEAQRQSEEVRIVPSLKGDESKHGAFFSRFMRDVAGHAEVQAALRAATQKRLFEEVLPGRFQVWPDDPAPAKEARALVTYRLLSEGMAAVAGIKGPRRVRIDEVRDINCGLYALHMLRLELPIFTLRTALEEIRDIAPPAAASTVEIFDRYKPFPFELTRKQFQ